MLPVVVPTPSVDLSRLDTGLVALIASFVGTSRGLINLALTCKSFGRRQPGSGLDWSLAEEAARQAAAYTMQNDIEGVRIIPPQYISGTTSWLSILHESEHPLKFNTLLGSCIEHASDCRTSVRQSQRGVVGAAVGSNYIMKSGIHYAEFQITAGNPYLGIVRPMPR